MQYNSDVAANRCENCTYCLENVNTILKNVPKKNCNNNMMFVLTVVPGAAGAEIEQNHWLHLEIINQQYVFTKTI